MGCACKRSGIIFAEKCDKVYELIGNLKLTSIIYEGVDYINKPDYVEVHINYDEAITYTSCTKVSNAIKEFQPYLVGTSTINEEHDGIKAKTTLTKEEIEYWMAEDY